MSKIVYYKQGILNITDVKRKAFPDDGSHVTCHVLGETKYIIRLQYWIIMTVYLNLKQLMLIRDMQVLYNVRI